MKKDRLLLFDASCGRDPSVLEEALSEQFDVHKICDIQALLAKIKLAGAIIVLDCTVTQGEALLRELRNSTDLPVLLVTASLPTALPEDIQNGLFAQMSHPFRPAQLVKRAKELTQLYAHYYTQQKKCREFHAILRHLDATVVELNLGTGNYQMLFNPNPAFQSLNQSSDFRQDLSQFLAEKVHPEERASIVARMKSCMQAQTDDDLPRESVEYRVYDAMTNAYRWFSSSVLYIDRVEGEKHIFIVIKDIDRMKTETALLESRARTDLLTGLSNKITAETQIEGYLQTEGQPFRHAMMIIDIDNFKQVNDQLGHMLGDAVLREISTRLKQLFRTKDILGRIGGDEFVVFQKNIPNRQAAEKRAQELVQVFRKAIVRTEQGYEISGSVGIALYPEDGDTFDELFLKADAALYQAKQAGKNCCVLYSPAAGKEHFAQEKAPHAPAPRAAEETERTELKFDFEAFVLRQFSEAKERSGVLQRVLDATARNFHLDHVYLMECGKGIIFTSGTGEAHLKFREFTRESLEFQQYASCCDEDGLFYCSDIQLLPKVLREFFYSAGIHSTLHVPIKVRGQKFGVLGFANLCGDWFWSQREVDVCKYLAHAIGVYYS